jgi:hypothetical protein
VRLEHIISQKRDRRPALANDMACSARTTEPEGLATRMRKSARKRNGEHGAQSARHSTVQDTRRHPCTATPYMARSDSIARRPRRQTSPHDKHGVNPRCDQAPLKVVNQLLPGRCSFRSWGSPTTRLYSPRESIPSRRGLDSVWADALLGFRLLRDFSTVIARDAFAPSTLSGFANCLVQGPCA